jgi:Flp pilus assembly pilin Flp
MIASLRNRRGATAVEYIVMLILTAMVILAIMRVFGSTIEAKYNDAHDELSGLETDRSKSGSSGSGGSGSRGSHNDDSAGGGSADKSSAEGTAEGSGSGSGSGSGAGANGSSGSGGESGDGSSGGGGGKSGNGGVSGPSDTSAGSLYVGGKAKPPEEEGPGFNPIILLAALGLVGLLFFVMSKGKDG